ncbi:MAG: O-antigen ligase family protein [Acidobacteriaceae bacterium]
MAIVFLLVIVALALIGLARPFYGFLGLMVVSILQPGELYPVLAPLHMERTLGIVVLASFLLHGQRLQFPVITKHFLAFYAAMWLAVPLAFWRGNSLQACIGFAPMVVYHLLIVSMLTDIDRFRKYLIVFAGLTGYLAGSAYWQYHKGVMQVTMDIDRAYGLTSSGGDPNSLANTLVFSLPLVYLLMTKDNSKKVRLLALSVFGISLVTIISTGSRTAFFTFILLVLLTVLRNKKNWKFLPLLPIAGLFLWMAIPQQYKARYETVDHLANDLSYQNRVRSWHGGIQMFLSNPLTGIGPNNYAIANGEKFWPGYPRVWLNAHSLYFQMLGEVGLIGMVAWYSFLVRMLVVNFRTAQKIRGDPARPSYLRQFPGMCNIALIAMLVAGYSSHSLYRDTWYSLAALSGAVQLLVGRQQEDASSAKEDVREGARPNRLLVPLPVRPSVRNARQVV